MVTPVRYYDLQVNVAVPVDQRNEIKLTTFIWKCNIMMEWWYQNDYDSVFVKGQEKAFRCADCYKGSNTNTHTQTHTKWEREKITWIRSDQETLATGKDLTGKYKLSIHIRIHGQILFNSYSNLYST